MRHNEQIVNYFFVILLKINSGSACINEVIMLDMGRKL